MQIAMTGEQFVSPLVISRFSPLPLYTSSAQVRLMLDRIPVYKPRYYTTV